MQPVETTRRQRLALLIQEAGTQSALSEKIEKSPAQISQWLNASRDSGLWQKAKEKVIGPAAGVSFTLLLEWLKEEGKRRLGIP